MQSSALGSACGVDLQLRSPMTDAAYQQRGYNIEPLKECLYAKKIDRRNIE